MSNQTPLQFPPLPPNEFWSLPDGFGYQHQISEASNTVAFDTELDGRDHRRCVVCGRISSGGLRPGVERAHVIGKTEIETWAFLKTTGFVPSFAKSVLHEPRNGISLCVSHHDDFDAYRFFIRWAPSESAFVFVNFSRHPNLEQFHGKKVALDPSHTRSPFPAPFLIQEMRTRGFYPWYTDQSIPCPLSPTYEDVGGGMGGDVMGLGRWSNIGPGSGGSDNREGRSGDGSGGAANPGSTSASGGNQQQQYLVLGNPFQDPELLDSMRKQWQELPSWKSAMVEGLTWEGTAEENAQKYISLVGAGSK